MSISDSELDRHEIPALLSVLGLSCSIFIRDCSLPKHSNPITTQKQWHEQFIDVGLQESRVSVLSTYAGNLVRSGLPVIFSFHHLCLLLGVTPRYLSSVIFSSHSHYRVFQIPKRSGGSRDIVAPYATLLGCQRWILQNILCKSKIHNAAHGYVSGRSIVSNAEKHVKRENLLKIDLKDFFPSISIGRIIFYFTSLGYTPEIAFFLARICCLEDALPQGAATSPTLSNIILRGMDHRLSRLSKKYGLSYSRYADDLAFSGKDITSQVIESIENIVNESGFVVNPIKKTLIKHGRRKILAGIDISSGRLRVPRDFRRQVRLEAHLAIKLGAVQYIIQNKRNPNALLEVCGKLSYWLHVEPENEFAIMAFSKIQEMCKLINGVRG